MIHINSRNARGNSKILIVTYEDRVWNYYFVFDTVSYVNYKYVQA